MKPCGWFHLEIILVKEPLSSWLIKNKHGFFVGKGDSNPFFQLKLNSGVFLVDPEVRQGRQVQVKVTVALAGATASWESDISAGDDGVGVVVTVAIAGAAFIVAA